MSVITKWTTVLLVVLALAACGDTTGSGDDPDVAAPSDDPSGEIADGDYVSTEVIGRTLVPGSGIRLGWRDGQVALRAGCNAMSGPASVEDGRLRVEGLAGTEMGCEPPLMEQDEWLVAFITSGPQVTTTDDGFTLRGDETTVRFATEAPPEPTPLEGTTWLLESTVDGPVASSTLGPDEPVAGPAADTPRLRIDGGRLQANDGCNEIFGPVEVTDDEIRGEQLASTRRACLGPAERTARIMGELLRRSSYAVEGDRLTLSGDDVAMVFRAR